MNKYMQKFETSLLLAVILLLKLPPLRQSLEDKIHDFAPLLMPDGLIQI